MASCGNNNADAPAASDNAPAANGTADAPPAVAANADADKGLELIAGSDCLTCHKVEEKLVGPAYRDIANKYPANQATIDTLAAKVISGGAGNWGDMAMTPHPALSTADAQLMVTYVMSLKQK